jgi:hypothetical protein
MKVTADLDRALAAKIKGLATAQKKTTGEVLVELARFALRPKAQLKERNGFLTIAKIKGGTPVTLELVNRLRDEEP